ncbi:hypothetical protein A2U01_0089286, partial [Trifolium medium]|nr:hypothetical protein [Trifolium medium]
LTQFDYDSWDTMSGARKGPGRPRRYVDEEEEPEMDHGGNMWVQMLQQQQTMLQQQQAMHHQYQARQAQAERQHREMMQVLQ